MTPALVYGPTAEQVARAIISSDAYIITLTKFAKWKNGIEAPVYADCRVINGHPGPRAIIMRALGSSIRANFNTAEYIIGIAEAGIVWSTLAATDLGLPHAFIRKQKKEHGHGVPSFIECSPPRGVRAVLVDDLCASGDSLQEAITVLHDEKDISTIGIQTIVNWDFLDMRDRFRGLGVPVRALASYPQLVEAAVEAAQVTERARRELVAFYRNPWGHAWNLEALNPESIANVF